MILSCNHIGKTFGVEEVLKDVSFHLEENEKAAIVGMNGAGKSTLLKIIVSEFKADEGEVTIGKGVKLGYLSQHSEFESQNTIYEEVEKEKQNVISLEKTLRTMESQMAETSQDELDSFMVQYHKLMDEFEAMGGYTYRGEITGVIRGLGFSDEEMMKPMNQLSGGQKTRVGLAKLLVRKPDVLLLDEPTNHLDIKAIEWLETYLKNYKGAVLIVSHDRYFLDRIVSKVIEIERHLCKVYKGSYTDYSKKKEAERAIYLKHYLEQQAEIKHHEKVIEKIKSYGTEDAYIRAKSREKLLDKIERLEKPLEIRNDMRFSLEPNVESGKDVLMVQGLSKSFGEQKLFQNISLDIKRGERIAIIGGNGTGKTTFLKVLNGILKADEGEFSLGSKVAIGYYDQEQQLLSEEKTLFDEIGDCYPNMTNTRIRNVLAAFLFTDDEVFKRISDLSGGERGRVSLAKLMLSEANFLILDEPTNHLDIVSKEILETALNDYTGTVLFVSHDRYFINRTATRILELNNHSFTNYLGDYDYYLEKSAQKNETIPEKSCINEKESVEEKASVLDWKEQKALAAKKRKQENEIAKIEQEIEKLETVLQNIEEEQLKPEYARNSAKLNELMNAYTTNKQQLDTLYETWENLTSEL